MRIKRLKSKHSETVPSLPEHLDIIFKSIFDKAMGLDTGRVLDGILAQAKRKDDKPNEELQRSVNLSMAANIIANTKNILGQAQLTLGSEAENGFMLHESGEAEDGLRTDYGLTVWAEKPGTINFKVSDSPLESPDSSSPYVNSRGGPRHKLYSVCLTGMVKLDSIESSDSIRHPIGLPIDCPTKPEGQQPSQIAGDFLSNRIFEFTQVAEEAVRQKDLPLTRQTAYFEPLFLSNL